MYSQAVLAHRMANKRSLYVTGVVQPPLYDFNNMYDRIRGDINFQTKDFESQTVKKVVQIS